MIVLYNDSVTLNINDALTPNDVFVNDYGVDNDDDNIDDDNVVMMIMFMMVMMMMIPLVSTVLMDCMISWGRVSIMNSANSDLFNMAKSISLSPLRIVG